MAISVLERYASIEDRANMSCGRIKGGNVRPFCLRFERCHRLLPTPKPTLVAILELQLHDLQNAEAALPPVTTRISFETYNVLDPASSTSFQSTPKHTHEEHTS